MQKAKSILITGASGFIGSHLVEEGLKRGYEVFAAIRKTSSRRYLTDSRIRILELDLFSPELLANQLSSVHSQGIHFNFIIHNAGITRANTGEEFNRVNNICTQNLVEALVKTSLIPGKFVFLSSLAAIGPGDRDSMQPISDSSVPSPIDAYGKSKRAAEVYLQSSASFPYLVIRPTGVYGPREMDYLTVFRNLDKGIELYAGSTSHRISFIYITDLTKVVYNAAESGWTRKTWVISDGGNYSVREFSALVKTILGKKTVRVVVPLPIVRSLASFLELAYRPFGKMPLLNRDKVAIMGSKNWQCDPSGIFADLNYSPAYNLEQGLLETIAWNRQEGRI
jgi:nucleoside-diphosphate-sugar epimerase